MSTSSGGGSAGSAGAKVARSSGRSSAKTALSSIASMVEEKGGAHLCQGRGRVSVMCARIGLGLV